ncbi:MAG: hypothetical protein SGARI_006653, partial [Bacillariaceae sp.]
MPSSSIQRTCGNCQSELENILRCSRCHVVFYCNKACQKEHWKQHRRVCKKITPLPEGSFFEDAQALAAQFPDTFGAPSAAEIANLKVGDWAKINYDGASRFWTIVEGIDKLGLEDPMEWRIIARTDNINPIEGLPHGSRIMFRGKNIYSV